MVADRHQPVPKLGRVLEDLVGEGPWNDLPTGHAVAIHSRDHLIAVVNDVPRLAVDDRREPTGCVVDVALFEASTVGAQKTSSDAVIEGSTGPFGHAALGVMLNLERGLVERDIAELLPDISSAGGPVAGLGPSRCATLFNDREQTANVGLALPIDGEDRFSG